MSNVSMVDGHIDDNQMTPEKAIKFFNEEIRRLELAPKVNGCEMTDEWAEQIEICQIAKSAIQKQIPKKPISQTEKTYDGDDIDEVFICSECKMFICHGEELDFCKKDFTHCHCGQSIDWGDAE